MSSWVEYIDMLLDVLDLIIASDDKGAQDPNPADRANDEAATPGSVGGRSSPLFNRNRHDRCKETYIRYTSPAGSRVEAPDPSYMWRRRRRGQ